MLRVASMVLAAIASLVLVDSVSAQQAQQSGQGQWRHGRFSLIERVLNNKDLNLTDDQKTKLTDLQKQYAPKLKDLAQTREKVFTADQRKARKEAIQAARAAGKRGSELREAAEAAMKLTDAQKAKLADVEKSRQTLRKEITDKVNKILTPAQQDVLKKARSRHGRRQNQGGGNNQQSSQVS